MATVNTRYIDVDAAAGGDGTTNGLSGGTCAYKSLSIWEAVRQADLPTGDIIEEAICQSTHASHTADAACYIDGWTTDGTRYIDIKTAAGSRHAGVWDDTKYRISSANVTALANVEDYVFLTGLQVEVTGTTNYRYGIIADPTGTVVSKCLVRGSSYTGISSAGISTPKHAYNNIVYDFATTDSVGISVPSGNAYNNTVVNCTTGYTTSWEVVVAKNNIASGCTTSFSGTFNPASDYNCSSTAAATGKTHDQVNQTFPFVGSGSYLLSSAYGNGVDLSPTITDDINGDTRSGTWDAGADEYVAAGPASILPLVAQDMHNTARLDTMRG